MTTKKPKIAKSVKLDDMKKLGFDLRLTEEDMFDLLLEQSLSDLDAQIAAVNAESNENRKNCETYMKELESKYLAEVKGDTRFNVLLSFDDLVITTRSNYAKLFVNAVPKKGQVNDFSFSVKRLLTADENKHRENFDVMNCRNSLLLKKQNMLMGQKQELERSPRKAKVAMLRKFLGNTTEGQNLLDMVSSVNNALLFSGNK